jgi:hypothetical protein
MSMAEVSNKAGKSIHNGIFKCWKSGKKKNIPVSKNSKCNKTFSARFELSVLNDFLLILLITKYFGVNTKIILCTLIKKISS